MLLHNKLMAAGARQLQFRLQNNACRTIDFNLGRQVTDKDIKGHEEYYSML